VRVMRGIALRRPIALAGLPDDVIVGDPTGFHMRAVEKDSQPLSAFANNSAHVSSPMGASPERRPRAANAVQTTQWRARYQRYSSIPASRKR
jgi:hypothetical protein